MYCDDAVKPRVEISVLHPQLFRTTDRQAAGSVVGTGNRILIPLNSLITAPYFLLYDLRTEGRGRASLKCGDIGVVCGTTKCK